MRVYFARLLRTLAEWIAPEPEPDPPVAVPRPMPTNPWAVYRRHHSDIDWSRYAQATAIGGDRAHGVAYREAA